MPLRTSPSLAGALALLALVTPAAAQAPMHVYLTWRGPTTTSMTVNAQTVSSVPEVEVRWDGRSRGGDPEAYVEVARGEAHRIAGVEDGRWVHWVDVTGLQPDTRYWFVVGSDTHGWSEEKSFETLPDDPGAPIRFLAGGDLGLGPEVRRLHAHGAAHEPDFAVIGGDIAYVDGDPADVEDWDQWLREWEEGMVTPDGLTVPMVLAPGNHEVQGGYLGGPELAPFYVGFFAQPADPSHFRLSFGPNVVLYVLDTGHVVSHESQNDWLDRVMAEDRAAGVPHRFAAYHIPLYPSHRDYEGGGSVSGRRNWLAIFDRHGLTAAFENHDHTLKRTPPLRGGEIVDAGAGTLYFGDGAWGRGDRTIDVTTRWYHAFVGSNRHVWLVDATAEEVRYRAFDLEGQMVHVYPDTLPGAEAADAYFRTLRQLWEVDDGFLQVEGPDDLDLERLSESPFTVRLRNTEAHPVRGMVDATAEAPLGVASEPVPFSLRPGETFETQVRLEGRPGDGLALATIRAALVFDRGADTPAELELARPVAFERDFVATRGPVPTLDGRVEEWSEWPIALTSPAPAEDPTSWSGESDASARASVRHDGTRAWIALDVTDDRVVRGTAGDLEAGDGVLVWIHGIEGEFDDDPYFGVRVGAGDGPAEIVSTDDGDWGTIARGSRAFTRRTDRGWTAEIEVPFDVLEGVTGALRINFALLDADGGEAETIYWRPEWESPWDAAAFGVVRLGN